MNSMCGTCGFESEATSEKDADREHLMFDPAHFASWYDANSEDIKSQDWK